MKVLFIALALASTGWPFCAQRVIFGMCGNRPNTPDKTCVVDVGVG